MPSRANDAEAFTRLKSKLLLVFDQNGPTPVNYRLNHRSTKPVAAIITALTLPAEMACIGEIPPRLPFGVWRNCSRPPGEIGAKMLRTAAMTRARAALLIRLRRRLDLMDGMSLAPWRR